MFKKVFQTFAAMAGFSEYQPQEMYNAVVCMAQSNNLTPQGLARAVIGFQQLYGVALNPDTIFDSEGENILRPNHKVFFRKWLIETSDDPEGVAMMLQNFLEVYSKLLKPERASMLNANKEYNAELCLELDISNNPFSKSKQFLELYEASRVTSREQSATIGGR